MRGVIVILALFVDSALAQENPLPLRRADGGMCFIDMTCAGPWREFVFRGDTGWYCEANERFCRTEGFGQACACSTSRPSGWLETGAVSGVPASVASIDYEAEIMAHVVDVCYLESLSDEAGIDDEQLLLAMTKLALMDEIDTLIQSVRPLVVGEDTETRMAFYELGATVCIQGNRNRD